jgi:pimeloyl-ACP methyl ester carboxylesterase
VNGVWHSFIVISPQFKVRPSAAHIQSVIDHAKAKFRVDATRIYVTGLSMGGGSTWDYSAVYGQNAAAIVPVCAGTKPTTTLAANVAAKNLPIWSINSTSDAVVPIQWGRDWITWIDQRNLTMAPHTKLTQWSGITHNTTWVNAFNPATKVDGYSMYEWMLLYKRGTATNVPVSPTPTPAPTPTPTTNQLPIARAGADKAIALNWNYMPTVWGNTSSDADGTIASYRWTKISGPTSFIIQTPTLNNTKITNLVVGTYVFRLTVTDNKGGVGTDDITITVTAK